MWMEDFSVVFDYAGSAGIFRIGGLCFLYSKQSDTFFVAASPSLQGCACWRRYVSWSSEGIR
jgi:hypothetical protein